MVRSCSRFAVLVLAATHFVLAQSRPVKPVPPTPVQQPWMDKSMEPAARAEAVLKQMTLDEKITLLHGEGMPNWPKMSPEILRLQNQGNGGAGFVLGVPRLGIPVIQMSDAAYGVRNSADNGRYSTALPSNLGSAASWDLDAACSYGALIGSELRSQGYNMTLGGGTNLTREPRNGRTFEYMGEDPVLAGYMVGARIQCEGDQHVISDIKHYAMNDQETGRTQVDHHVTERAMRESDLLAFEIGIRAGKPKAVMCSYNGVNGDYACQSKYLLTDVLKSEWKFPGYVISDWGATHSTVKASHAGLDQEEPLDDFYGKSLKAAVLARQVPLAELDDHARRVLYAEFASGIVDYPVVKGAVDPQKGFDIAQSVEAGSVVLLKNEDGLLPLSPAVKAIAIIGRHADTGMISGGGSAQVDAPGPPAGWRHMVWFPTSPLEAVKSHATSARYSFASGEDIDAAVAAAKGADVAVVFAWQWQAEGEDLPSLSLPEGQDKLIAAVAAVNPHTIVVLETGSAVTMPWLSKVSGVLEAWYGGSKGASAVADVLFGTVDPSGKLPMTFPVSEADLPRPAIAPEALKGGPPTVNGQLAMTVDYTEGAKVGYKWYEAEKKPVLFPFGFGLSYTTFKYGDLNVTPDGRTARFSITNTGKRAGAEVAQVYASLPESAGEPWKRLIGWKKVMLAAGETRDVSIETEPLAMSVWDETSHAWTRPSGVYKVQVGGSSAELPLQANFKR